MGNSYIHTKSNKLLYNYVYIVIYNKFSFPSTCKVPELCIASYTYMYLQYLCTHAHVHTYIYECMYVCMYKIIYTYIQINNHTYMD